MLDLAESSVRTFHLRDDSPPSLRWGSVILLGIPGPVAPSVHTSPSSPAPSPRGEGVRRAQGDPHLWLLDHVEVLTRDSDDSATTAEMEFKLKLKTYFFKKVQ